MRARWCSIATRSRSAARPSGVFLIRRRSSKSSSCGWIDTDRPMPCAATVQRARMLHGSQALAAKCATEPGPVKRAFSLAGRVTSPAKVDLEVLFGEASAVPARPRLGTNHHALLPQPVDGGAAEVASVDEYSLRETVLAGVCEQRLKRIVFGLVRRAGSCDGSRGRVPGPNSSESFESVVLTPACTVG